MATETDLRLRSWLDGNQRDREQMCRAVLALDQRYTDVRPRHPSGGPDGGRDIEAIFESDRKAFGAVGFTNGANDSETQKKQIRRKFSSDLKAAIAANPQLKGFAFLTNLHFTVGEQDEMRKEAKVAGLEHCDVLDRERLRIELDAPSGFFIRFQHLGISLSEAEQASFLSKYGTQIQEVVTTGFKKVEKTLDRILFLNEAKDTLESLTFRFVLKKPYIATEIEHFRTFVFLTLREYTPGMLILWFGSSDCSNRFRDDIQQSLRKSASGVGNGIGSGQWERYLPKNFDLYDAEQGVAPDETEGADEQTRDLTYEQTSWSSSRGLDPVPALFATYRHAGSRSSVLPMLALRDLDDGMFLPFVNASIAEKIHSIQVFANGYKLVDIGPADFDIDRTACAEGLPGGFNTEELADSWVRIRPSNFNSAFTFCFGETTPRRVYGHEHPMDSPPPPEMD